MASINLGELKKLVIDSLKEMKDAFKNQDSINEKTSKSVEKFSDRLSNLEGTLKDTASSAGAAKKTLGTLAETTVKNTQTITNLSKENIKLSKGFDKQADSIANLKSKIKELKDENSKLSSSFKVTGKSLNSMLREAFFANKKTGIAAFFKKEFGGITKAITDELKSLKTITINMGGEIGANLIKGVATGVNQSNVGGIGIGENIHKAVTKSLGKSKSAIRDEIALAIRNSNLEGIAQGMRELKKHEKMEGLVKEALNIEIFGGEDKKNEATKVFNESLTQIDSYYKQVLSMTDKHGMELTERQNKRLEEITNIASAAKELGKVGIMSGDPDETMRSLADSEKRIAKLKQYHERSLSMSHQHAREIEAQKKAEIESAIRADKIDEMLLEEKLKRQKKLSKSIVAVVEQQEKDILKLTTGSDKRGVGLLGKKATGLTATTDEEKDLARIIQSYSESIKALNSLETQDIDSRKSSLKHLTQQYDEHVKELVNMMNVRAAAEKQGADDKAKADAMEMVMLKTKMKEYENFEKRFSEIQERTRKLLGNFTEEEKFTKSKNFLSLSMDTGAKEEVDQANRLIELINRLDVAKKRLKDSDDDSGLKTWLRRISVLEEAAKSEEKILKEMVYARLNAEKSGIKAQKETAKTEDDLLKEALDRGIFHMQAIQRQAKEKTKIIKDESKKSARALEEEQKQYVQANRAVITGMNRMSAAMGLGWRNRNIVESLQRTAQGFTTFARSLSGMAKEAAKNIALFTAAITGMAAAVAASLAYASKKMYDFGKSIVTTTEEIRGYEIALYGMMGTQRGVNDMMSLAEKITKDMPIGFKTIQKSVKGLVLIGPVRDMFQYTSDLEGVMGRLFKIVVGLSTIQPEWGAKGAIFSLRNALTGDLRSLQRRFELPVRAIYSSEGVPLQELQYQPEKMVETLETYISSFYSAETLKMAANQFSAIIEKIEGNWIRFLKSIGDSGLYDLITGDLGRIRDAFQNFVDSDVFSKVVKSISDSFGNIYEAVRNVATYGMEKIALSFGIEGFENITTITGALENVAKLFRVMEDFVTSGKLGDYFTKAVEKAKELIKPLKYIKDLIFEMVDDAKALVSRLAELEIFKGIEKDANTLLGNRRFEKGLLWALFFGPGNVAGLFSGMLQALHGITGMIINTFILLVASVKTFAALWATAWFAPLAKVGAAIAGVIGLYKGFQHFFGKDQKTIETQEDYDRRLKYVSDFLKPYDESKINSLKGKIDRLEKENEATLTKAKPFDSWMTKYKSGEQRPAGVDDVGSFLHTAIKEQHTIDDIVVKDISTLRAELEMVDAARKEYAEILKMDRESLKKASDGGSIFQSIEEFFLGKDTKSDALGIESVMNKLKEKTAIGMKTPVVLEGIKEGTAFGGYSVLELMDRLGFSDAKITSAYRHGDPRAHGKGMALDIQDLSKSMMDEQLFAALSQLKSLGYIKKAIVEQDRQHSMFDFDSPLLKQYGIGHEWAKQSQGHLHIEFTEKAKELALALDGGSNILDVIVNFANGAIESGKRLMEDTKLQSYSGTAFKDPFEHGAEMLKTMGNLETVTSSVTAGLNQHIKNISNIVEESFNKLKEDEGHMFGPAKIKELQVALKVAMKEREKSIAQMQNTSIMESMLPKPGGGSFMLRTIAPLIDTYLPSDAESRSAFMMAGKLLSTELKAFNLKDYTDLDEDELSGAIINKVESIKSAIESVYEWVFNPALAKEKALKEIDVAKQFSAEFLKDDILKEGFDLAMVSPDFMKETWGRQFDTEALRESLRLTMATYSEVAATEEEISRVFNNALVEHKKGMELETALSEEIKKQVKWHNADEEKLSEIVQLMLKMKGVLTDNSKEFILQEKTTKGLVDNINKATAAQLKDERLKALISPARSVREASKSRYEHLVAEGLTNDNLGTIFKTGIEDTVSTFDTFGEIVLKQSGELANGMRGAFEDGFFDAMTGKIKSLGDMFKNLGNVIWQTIARILAQMAALSATKLILGIDISGQMGGQGGLSGLMGLVSGGGAGGAGGILGGAGGLGGIFDKVIGGIFGSTKTSTTNTADVGAMALQLAGAPAGVDFAQLAGQASLITTTAKSGGALGGLLDKAGKWLMSPTGLLTAGAVAFLTQPGRLFGGTRDKTGAAQQQLADYNAKRQAYLDRRTTDTLSYYMADYGGLRDFDFAGISYSEWKSGDGWFKGPKEKHAATDPSAFLRDLDKYYKELMAAGKLHYAKMFEINKLAETNSIASLRMQQEFDKKKLALIKEEYARYASTDYAADDKYEKMDEFRDKQLEQEYSNRQLQNEIENVAKETRYAEMRYLTYMQSSGEDLIAIAKTEIAIQKLKIKELTVNTLEWYNAQMELMDAERDLARKMGETIRQFQGKMDDLLSTLYFLGQNTVRGTFQGTPIMGYDPMADEYAGLLGRIEGIEHGQYHPDDLAKLIQTGSQKSKEFTWKEISQYRYLDAGFFSDFPLDIPDYWWNSPEFKWEQEHVAALTPKTGIVPGGESSKWTIGGVTYSGGDTITFDKDIIETWYQKEYLMETLYSIGDFVDMTLDEIMLVIKEDLEHEASLFLQTYSFVVEKKKLYENISNVISNVDRAIEDRFEYLQSVQINLETDPYMTPEAKKTSMAQLGVEIANFYNDLSNNIGNWLKAGYLSIGSITVKDFADAIQDGLNEIAVTIYDDLRTHAAKMTSSSRVLSTIRDMDDFTIYQEVMGSDEMSRYRMALGSNIDVSGYQDPYDAWFHFNKSMIETRIANATDGSNEWYEAQDDLFNLMIDNAIRLREKAEKMNQSLEDMLAKIEETMRMRIAEERETTKGDTYFIDVGSTRDSQHMLDRMLSAVKTNDPDAMRLIEEFKRKMLGIGR